MYECYIFYVIYYITFYIHVHLNLKIYVGTHKKNDYIFTQLHCTKYNSISNVNYKYTKDFKIDLLVLTQVYNLFLFSISDTRRILQLLRRHLHLELIRI